MPTLLIIAVLILLRVLLGTPDSNLPDRNVNNGLGFMWNPVKHVVESKQEDGNWILDKQIVDRDLLNSAHTILQPIHAS